MSDSPNDTPRLDGTARLNHDDGPRSRPSLTHAVAGERVVIAAGDGTPGEWMGADREACVSESEWR